MKTFFKRLFGISRLEEAKDEAKKLAAEAENRAVEAARTAQLTEKQVKEMKSKLAEEERLAKLTPKERATAKGEPWVSVLDMKVNAENPRNGFFELDWNDQFVLQLKQAGYGFDGDPDEEIVDRWFKDLARNILSEEGLDPTRGAGYINVIPISQGKSEIS